MPFSSAFQHHRWVDRAVKIRRNRASAYGIAAAAVGIATGLRWLVGGYAMEGTPFITYYPAIVLATMFGGLWPGIFATVASALLAWFAFIPPELTFALTGQEAVSLLLFIAIATVNVVLVAMLNTAYERIVGQEQNVRVLIESAPNGIVLVDERGVIKLVNASTERLFGFSRAELIGQQVEVLVPEPQLAVHRAARGAFQRAPQARAMGMGRDLSGRRKDGSEFAIEIGLNPVSGGNGNDGVLATVIDISERKRAHERQQLLVRELMHRSRNLFSVIESIAARSFVEGQSAAEGRAAFRGRLHALARAHATLADAAWKGVPLGELLKQVLDGFTGNLSISGCDIVVNTPAAQHFALIAHELATNAIKHGSLSVPKGRVSVEGRIERANGHDVFSFLWAESAGPPVAEPTRRGFGSVILLEVARQFGQHVAMKYHPTGVTYELRLSLDAIEAANRNETMALTS